MTEMFSLLRTICENPGWGPATASDALAVRELLEGEWIIADTSGFVAASGKALAAYPDFDGPSEPRIASSPDGPHAKVITRAGTHTGAVTLDQSWVHIALDVGGRRSVPATMVSEVQWT